MNNINSNSKGDYHESEGIPSGAKPTNPLVKLDPGLFIWTILTFLILLMLLSKFAWKPILKALDERERKIKASLENAEKAKEELVHLNVESEKILAEARSKAQQIRADAKVAAEKIGVDIKRQAENHSKKIKDDANNQIQVEKEKAIGEIRNEVVSLSMQVAEKIIGKNLSTDDNQDIIDKSLAKLKEYEA